VEQGPVSVSSAPAISVLSSQPLAGRKTDEGFAIYKEDELSINAEAGGQFNPPTFVGLFTSP
jgi:hypothetical protein